MNISISIHEYIIYYLIITIEKSRGSHKTPEEYTIYNPAVCSRPSKEGPFGLRAELQSHLGAAGLHAVKQDQQNIILVARSVWSRCGSLLL